MGAGMRDAAGGGTAASSRTTHRRAAPSAGAAARARAARLAELAELYLHVADDGARAGELPDGASLAPDVASATFYAVQALAMDADSVYARRQLATCYLLGGAALVFPFSPSSVGEMSAPAARAGKRAHASALAAIHVLQHGPPATFQDLGCARVYASACTALGRFQEAQEALEWTLARQDAPQEGASAQKRAEPHTAAPPPPRAAPPVRHTSMHAVYQGQVLTQLGRIAMKQARYEDAARHLTRAREADPLNWGAWTCLCDMALAPPAAEAFPESLLGDLPSEPAASSSAPPPAEPAPRRAPAAPAAPTAAKRIRAAPPPGAPEGPRPVRRVTPRAAAQRTRREGAAPAPEDVPPVPRLPDTGRPNTLAASRTNTNRAASSARAADAKPGAKPEAPPATRRSARTASAAAGAQRAPSAASARSGSAERPGATRTTRPAAAGAARPPSTTATARPAARPRPGVRSTLAAAADRSRSPPRRAPAAPAAPAPAADAPAHAALGADADRWVGYVLRELGEAYRLVRLYLGHEAVALLTEPPKVPAEESGMAHALRHTAAARCLLGRAYHDITEYAAAERQFAAARAQEPYLLMHMDIYSLVLFQLHREVALAALAQALAAIEPRAAAAHMAAGNTWSLQQEHDAALRCFEQATLVAPECAYAYTLAGYEALELEQPARAMHLFRSARRCDRRHWNALAGLGHVYLRAGNAALAAEAYADAFLINSSNPVLLDLLGWALEHTGELEDALAVYARAIRMQPKAAMTRLKRAQLLLRTVRLSMHRERRGGEPLDLDDAELALLRGARRLSRAEQAQRRQDAHAELIRVCALAPNEPQVHLLLARSYMRLGGGHFASGEPAGLDATPPASPGAGEMHQPGRYRAEIAQHLATAVDLDPRCVREVTALGEGAKLALHGGAGASVAEDEEELAEAAYDGEPAYAYETAYQGALPGVVLPPEASLESSDMVDVSAV